MESTQFIGQILLVPYNFCPKDWAYCDGRTLQISNHNALFSLLGTTYGGDGRTTFALPDLRDRVPVGASQTLHLGDNGGNVAVSPPLPDKPQPTIKTQGTLAMTYIIALEGIYPPRD